MNTSTRNHTVALHVKVLEPASNPNPGDNVALELLRRRFVDRDGPRTALRSVYPAFGNAAP
jgi:hypothetical protein